MSLLRLLTTGKSLVGLKKLEQRYRLPNAEALPKFGSKKNPFRATVLPEKCEVSPVSPDTEASHEPANLAASTSESAGPLPFNEAKLLPISNSKPVLEAPGRRPSAFRALFLWGRAKKNKPAAMANGHPLVQAELSLDAVRVVRNDLSETDLEVVAAEPRAKPTPARVEPEPSLGMPQVSCARTSGQLLEAGKM